jgi:hypothetical protein
MTITKIYITAIMAAIVVIATSTTIAFPSVTVLATTPLTSPEQPGTDTTTDAATSPPAGQQQQQTIHITKDGTNSYTISGQMSSVGSFDTTYRIAGERSAIRSAENLIISTITEDFRNSPTIGYIRAGGGGATGTEPTLPSPFATPEQITERTTTELRSAITEAENTTSQGQHVEIKCDFGMSLDEMRCHVPSVGAEVGGAAATTPTDTTDTTGTTTDDTTTPIAPLEGQ